MLTAVACLLVLCLVNVISVSKRDKPFLHSPIIIRRRPEERIGSRNSSSSSSSKHTMSPLEYNTMDIPIHASAHSLLRFKKKLNLTEFFSGNFSNINVTAQSTSLHERNHNNKTWN